MTSIESDFHKEMLKVYERAKEECHYNATYFLRMVSEMGGLRAAKRLLSADASQYGFTKLWERGRLDLSVEALALDHRFRSLFTGRELNVAKNRLKAYGYTVEAGPSSFSTAQRLGEAVLHYTDLVKAHKLYLQEEGRDKFYDAYMEDRDPSSWTRLPSPRLRDVLLLFGWVLSWDSYFQGNLARFLQVYEGIFPRVKNLEGWSIVNADFTDDVKESLRVIFDSIAKSCLRYESTDTSKILHAINPELFVMWDDRIKKGIIGVRQSAKDYDGKCYAYEFLPQMQEFARHFLDSYVEENHGDYEHASKQISQMAGGRTLAKLVDEFNYVRFTKGKTLTEIRSVPL